MWWTTTNYRKLPRTQALCCRYGSTLRAIPRKNAQVVTDLQTSCNKVVVNPISGCVRNVCPQLLYQQELLQVDNSLFQTCWQLGTSSGNTTCWRLVERKTCYIYTRENAQVVTGLQTSCNKVVVNPISGCVRNVCPQLLYQQGCYKLITACFKLVDNLGQAVGTQLVDGLLKERFAIYTHVKTHKLLQVCKQVVTNLFTSCRQVVFALLLPSCCNKFWTSC
jgi:hypothetical protein